MKIKLTMFILFAALFGCSKGGSLVLNGPLTDCPANSTCSDNYYDHASLNASVPAPGNYRVFAYQRLNSLTCGASVKLFFTTSLSNNDFQITSRQITAPSTQVVVYDRICPCCYSAIVSQPIGGLIKGKKSGPNLWLINASIIFGTSDGRPTDTLTVNQYFTLAKLP